MVGLNFNSYEVTIANSGVGELDLSAISTEKTVKINPGAASVRLLVTASTSAVDATVISYLLINGENEFELGGGLDRLSIYNGSGGQVKVSIAVMS